MTLPQSMHRSAKHKHVHMPVFCGNTLAEGVITARHSADPNGACGSVCDHRGPLVGLSLLFFADFTDVAVLFTVCFESILSTKSSVREEDRCTG